MSTGLSNGSSPEKPSPDGNSDMTRSVRALRMLLSESHSPSLTETLTVTCSVSSTEGWEMVFRGTSTPGVSIEQALFSDHGNWEIHSPDSLTPSLLRVLLTPSGLIRLVIRSLASTAHRFTVIKSHSSGN